MPLCSSSSSLRTLLRSGSAALLLVALNSTARFQNWRYAAPTLLMLLLAAGLGAGALARRRPRALAQPLAAALLLLVLVAPASWFPTQISHFARASANIAGQQVEVARRLAAREPRPRRVLVGDAGAIPYLSGLDAIDGKIKLLDEQPADWDVTKVARIWDSILTKHPDISAAFFHNDDMALAAHNVMKAKNRTDILIAGGRNLYTALKARIPFLDINQEREFGYAGYTGMVELARQLHLSISSPVWPAVRQPAPWADSRRALGELLSA